MSIPTASPDRLVAPTQVWAFVPIDLQQRTIQFMAHLATNLVVAQAPQAEPGHNEEVSCADPG